jgi:hypothetical protein
LALVHYSKSFGVKEMKVAKLLTDPTGAPPATYGTSIPLVGSQKMSLTGVINSKFLRGDNMLLDADAVWDSLTATVDYAKISLDAMSVFYSTATVDSGTTPNQLATLGMKNTDVLQYFKLEGRSASADPIAGDFLFSLWKCKLASFPTLGLMEEDYQRAALTVNLMPRLADNLWISAVIRETAAALT